MRIAVADVLGWLAAGMSHQQILGDYPELTDDDIRACLAYAADRERRVMTSVKWIFPASEQVRRCGLASAVDRAIWDYAGANGFALVSLDANFAEFAALLGPPPKVIWLHCGNQSTTAIARLLRMHFEAIVAFEHDESACLEIY